MSGVHWPMSHGTATAVTRLTPNAQRQGRQACLFPLGQRADSHQKDGGGHQREKDRVEVRRAN
jgi:hypothetical protein